MRAGLFPSASTYPPSAVSANVVPAWNSLRNCSVYNAAGQGNCLGMCMMMEGGRLSCFGAPSSFGLGLDCNWRESVRGFRSEVLEMFLCRAGGSFVGGFEF